MNSENLNSFISEDVVTDDEDCNASNLMKLDQLTELNLHALQNVEKYDSDLTNDFHLASPEDNDDCPDSLQSYFELDLNDLNKNSDQEIEQLQLNKYCESVFNRKQSQKIGGNVENLNEKIPVNILDSDYENVEVHKLKIPSSKIRLLSDSGIMFGNGKTDEEKKTKYSDSTELENEINDSLLDMLQGELPENSLNAPACHRFDEKKPDNSLKFVTIFPAASGEKIINLMVKGKSCRSKQPLNVSELRIVNRILNQENTFGWRNGSYKNVYYDAESDTNIRYEVRQRTPIELGPSSNASFHSKNKKIKLKSSQRVSEENDRTVSDKGKFVWNKVARTRFGRISRPPRHVIRDYKRFKHLSEPNKDIDDSENSRDYADYVIEDDSTVADEDEVEDSKKRDNFLYGPLEPNKRQFSSLSICPTCNKVYLGYRRMAIHFQKYPDHKNEDLLKQLQQNTKKETEAGFLKDRLVNIRNNSCSHCGFQKIDTSSRKRKFHHKMKTPNLRSPAACIRELLSRFGAREISKSVGPIVAGTLTSWDYMLMRCKQMKNGDDTLLISLMNEINVIFSELRLLSSNILKPLKTEEEPTSNKLTIEENDIWQHIFDVSPGTYAISDGSTSSIEFEKHHASLSEESPLKPDVVAHSVDNTTAKLFDAAVAECLKDSTNLDPNVTPDQETVPNCQIATVFSFDGPQTDDHEKVYALNTIPTFSMISGSQTSDLPDSRNLAVDAFEDPPQTLDFSTFHENSNNTVQFMTDLITPLSVNSFAENSSAQNKSQIDDSSLLIDGLLTSKINEQNLHLSDLLDFT